MRHASSASASSPPPHAPRGPASPPRHAPAHRPIRRMRCGGLRHRRLVPPAHAATTIFRFICADRRMRHLSRRSPQHVFRGTLHRCGRSGGEGDVGRNRARDRGQRRDGTLRLDPDRADLCSMASAVLTAGDRRTPGAPAWTTARRRLRQGDGASSPPRAPAMRLFTVSAGRPVIEDGRGRVGRPGRLPGWRALPEEPGRPAVQRVHPQPGRGRGDLAAGPRQRQPSGRVVHERGADGP